MQIAGEIAAVSHSGPRTLTVYIANDYKQSEETILGGEGKENGLLWHAYREMLAKKRENSAIMLSVMGIEHENELTDLLVIDRPSEMGEELPDHLKGSPFLKRRVRVCKHPDTRRYYA
jgi:hypothetical protein